jgi:hypothetical protein
VQEWIFPARPPLAILGSGHHHIGLAALPVGIPVAQKQKIPHKNYGGIMDLCAKPPLPGRGSG